MNDNHAAKSPPRRATPRVLGVVVALIVALIVTGVSMELYGAAAYDRLSKTSNLLIAERTAYGHMVDMQTAERGYVITADESFLEPYQPARDALPAQWVRMESLADELDRGAPATNDGRPSLRDLVAEMRSAADTWINERAEPNLALVRSARQSEALANMSSNLAQSLFSRVRDAANQLSDKTDDRLASATNDLNLARQLELALLVVLGALAAASAIVAIQSARRDADQQEEARLSAEAEQQRLLTVIENQPIGVWLVRQRDGAVILQNSAAASIVPQETWNSIPITNHSESFGLVKADGTPVPPDEAPVRRVLREGITITDYELKMLKHPDGEKDLLVSVAPLYDERGRVTSAVVVMQDVTQMKRLDQRKDEFIATAAHEIRNPLAALSGYQQILRRTVERSETPPVVAKNVEAIGKQVDRLNNLVERLLDAQRIQLGRLVLDRTAVNLNRLVESVVADTRAAAGESHELVADLPSEEIKGEWDDTRIEQVLSNLLTNALHHSPAGSRIEVRVRPGEGEVRVEVIDQGPGIPPEKRARLFDRYYQSGDENTTGHLQSSEASPNAGRRRGLGLGLYISCEIVRAHKGKIDVGPNPEGGSIFWFTLPLTEF